MFTDLLNDLRYALRAVLRERGFSTVAIVTLGLGIGATTALFSVADSVLIRPLPWSTPERLVRIEERRSGQPGRVRWTVTNGAYNAWRDSHQTLDALAAWRTTAHILHGAGDAERVLVTATSPKLFGMLGARPAIGRPFIDADAAPGARATAILSYGLWQQRFGGDRDVIARAIRLDDRDYEVVGVMPRGFAFPDRDTRVWIPFEPLPLMSADGRQMRIIAVEAIGRLADGATAEQAAAEATARARTVPDIRQAALSVFGASGEVGVSTALVQDVLTGEVRPALTLLLAAVFLLLLATMANVISMQMARATARRREMAVRLAMGGGRWRLTRLWLVESAVLGTCAGLVGIALAALAHQILPAWLPADFPRVDEIILNERSLAWAFAVTVLVAVVCGTLPSWFAQSSEIARDLAGDGSAQSGSPRQGVGVRLQAALVIGQVSAACVLLIGGALLARSFAKMIAADRGYDPTNVLTARLTLPHDLPGPQRVQFLERLQERLRSQSEVREVAFGNGLPLLSGGTNFGRDIPSPTDASVILHVAATSRAVSPEYLSTLRSRIVQGRTLQLTDTVDTPRVMVVNRSFASQYLGPDPIGLRLQLGFSEGTEWEVVGVTDDLRPGPLTEPIGPEFFVSTRQRPNSIAFDPVLLVRTADDPANHAAALRDFAREIDPAAAIDSIMTMDERLQRSLGRPRAYALVLGGLAALSLAICAVGVFGLLSYTTALRTAEIGLRVAVGAAPGQIAGLIIRQALRLVAIGLAIGLTVTVLLAESMSRFVYGIATRDFVSFAVAPLAVGALGLIAAAWPARSAARLDPLRALRAR
ncbi:MAG: ABC transporter permease [Acidobacteriota bacterium]|nr:ABC transporter permease [Acidobacteriota bacterium]